MWMWMWSLTSWCERAWGCRHRRHNCRTDPNESMNQITDGNALVTPTCEDSSALSSLPSSSSSGSVHVLRGLVSACQTRWRGPTAGSGGASSP
eukprot:CAMPEP_0174368204 /NCGR_PEP_ID=MMETSP0811_2-20130205/88219_1 /TAXON_ID=73025 ORGANISM="Eutreptiella gymnastica-like, Strain CCMP1594" /NCGR_SAMPLE_ID=MMETSP0811_2 /ASSEMBLY_ACC=CAM_ASM_000667 /LENGTH=92 /DNA_ID=CAMNT_0015511483 /DNA_START=27 /DNA_END=301 /DNA_ORIENTATION=+